MVIVCCADQLTVVKVILDVLIVPSEVSLLLRSIETSKSGSAFRTTVKFASTPCSVVIRPASGVTATPAESLSIFIRKTLSGSNPL